MPLALILPYLPQMISAGEKLWSLVSTVRSAAQQSGEWTPDHEAQFQAGLVAMGQAPESLPDAK
jgi:hypothetical protein